MADDTPKPDADRPPVNDKTQKLAKVVARAVEPAKNIIAWEKWLRATGYGVYALGAIALLFYAIAIKQIGFSYEALRPYVVGILAVGVVLGTLDYGRTTLKQTKLRAEWLGTLIQIAIGVLFIVISFAACIWIVVLILRDAGVIGDGATLPTHPPQQFTFAQAGTYADEQRLPNAVFGNAQDDTGRPRAWMRQMEMGAAGLLGAPTVQVFWLLTNERANTAYTAFLNVGTEDDVAVVGYLLEPGAGEAALTRYIPLLRKFSADNATYLFDVPEAGRESPLLFLAAMSDATFQKWRDNVSQFKISSQP